jgi:hypothetical protein
VRLAANCLTASSGVEHSPRYNIRQQIMSPVRPFPDVTSVAIQTEPGVKGAPSLRTCSVRAVTTNTSVNCEPTRLAVNHHHVPLVLPQPVLSISTEVENHAQCGCLVVIERIPAAAAIQPLQHQPRPFPTARLNHNPVCCCAPWPR